MWHLTGRAANLGGEVQFSPERPHHDRGAGAQIGCRR